MRQLSKKILMYVSILICLGALGACSSKVNSLQEQIQAKANENTLGQSKNVQIFDTPYMKASVKELDSRSPEFDKRVTLSQRGTMHEILQSLEEMFPLSFQIQETDTALHRIYYEGTLKGLLDTITHSTGYGWHYKDNAVVFSRVLSKTYTLLAIPGSSSYENEITNENKDSSSSSAGTGVGQTVTTSNTEAQTAQTTSSAFKIDSFEETVASVKALLSKDGTVTANQGAGTITVHDNAINIAKVDSFIDEINKKMGRQVALNVQVWSLEVNDDMELGFNINALFENNDFSILAGSVSSFTNAITATIASGTLKDSVATLQALKEWGNASSVTSASGIVMSNQAMPTLAVQKQGYLSSVSTETTDYGQTTSITPGEVTTGFAMTVIPHILEKRELILQYNVNLSHLDEMQRYEVDSVAVDLPQISSRAFSQRMRMKMGQTLILAGYQQDTDMNQKSLGFLSTSKNRNKSKSLLIITIQVENADI